MAADNRRYFFCCLVFEDDLAVFEPGKKGFKDYQDRV